MVASALDRETDGLAVRVRLVPALRMLEQDIDTRFFMGQTVIEILRERLGSALAAWGRELDAESRITGQYNRRDYCVQFRESTFAFCSRLMEEEGIAYVFVPDHENQRETMVLIDNNASYAGVDLLVPGAVPIISTAAEELDREAIQSFEWRRKRTPNRVLTRGYNLKNPAQTDNGQAERQDRGRAIATEQYLDGERRQIIDDPIEDPEAQRFTGAELDQRPAMAMRALQRHTVESSAGHGRSNAIGFAAGGSFELADPADGADGEQSLLIVRVEHHGRSQQQGAASTDAAYQNRFECIRASTPFRPALVTPPPRVYGVQTGVVVGRKSDEIYTDPFGRVRVKFHRDRSEVDGEHASCWIPVAQMWAGNGYGSMIIPRVGMEVVVSFVDGNPDCPLVTGTIYRGGESTPYPLPSELSKATIKTRSTPGGDGFNELRIEDHDGREQIFVHAQRRMDMRVRGVLYETSVGGREEVVGSKDAESDFLYNNLHVHGHRNERVEQNRYVLVAGADLYMVSMLTSEVEDEHLEFVGGRSQLSAAEILVEAQDFIYHTAKTLESAASSTVSVKGGERVVIESNNRIDLVVGQSFISLTPTTVEIGGGTILLNSGGGPTGRASDGHPAVEASMLEALEALVADDGRPHKGGGGGGRRSRHRRHAVHRLVPKHAPPMEPMKPQRPDPDRPTAGRILELRWDAADAWCSEPAPLRVRCEGYDGSSSETLIIDNEADGAAQCVDVVRPVAPDRSFGVDIIDVLPRKIGEGYESERMLQASLVNAKTVLPIRLRFITEVPRIRYTAGRSRFDLSVSKREVEIGGTVEYTRGWIFYIIRLGDLVPEGTGGIIGGQYYGSEDWRYCKPTDEDETRYVYWNGGVWVPVPKGWNDPIHTKLYGMAVWREGNEVKTQLGEKAWPDPVPSRWTDEATDFDDGKEEHIDWVEMTTQHWADTINAYWSGQMDLQRVECRGRAVECCRYRVRCVATFEETDHKGSGIILAHNFGRANASAWPYESDDETVLHEFGHHLGNPDEYEGATTVDPTVNGDGAKAGIDKHGLMGSGDVFRRRYYNSICKALAQAVAEHTGKLYSYKAVESLGGGA